VEGPLICENRKQAEGETPGARTIGFGKRVKRGTEANRKTTLATAWRGIKGGSVELRGGLDGGKIWELVRRKGRMLRNKANVDGGSRTTGSRKKAIVLTRGAAQKNPCQIQTRAIAKRTKQRKRGVNEGSNGEGRMVLSKKVEREALGNGGGSDKEMEKTFTKQGRREAKTPRKPCTRHRIRRQ